MRVMSMRNLTAMAVVAMAFAPALASAAIPCSDLPKAQSFVERLHPGPNTRQAQHHLALAKNAHSERRCSAELAKVDHYARRSAEADKRIASREH